MSEDAIAVDDMPIPRKSVLPGAGFFVPDDVQENRREERTAAALDGASAAVLADPDADGLACVAILRELHDDRHQDLDLEDPEYGQDHEVALVPTSPHDLADSLERVATYAPSSIDIYVCDLAPDSMDPIAEPLASTVESATAVEWYDHHQWDDAVATAVREAGVDLEVGDSETECSADVLVRSVPGADEPALRELAAVTRDHDLWIRDDPRSQDLADFAYWSNPNVYVETVREHGPDLPESVSSFLEQQRIEKEALIEQALGRAEYRDIGDLTVGVTYGRCSQNEVAEGMRSEGADLSIVVKPAGSASLRGTDTFERCHEVAALVNGGGHPKAAGCKPPVHEDMLDFANHWVSRGAVTKRVILDAVETVVESDD